MTAKIAQAFSPAGLSSFFEICDINTPVRPVIELDYLGARGGGFGLKKGILTKVTVSKTKANRIQVSINAKPAPEAETTIATVQMLLESIKETYNITVDHKIEVPIGAGFGTSAAGALTTGLALKETLDLPLTFNQIGKVAHAAEINCKTGLGTVGPLMIGGCVLTLEPGAPGISIIDRIPLTPKYVIVAGVFGPTPTKQILSSAEKRCEINRCGKKTLDNILANPSLENFLSCCWQFAQDTGFATERVKQLVRLAKKAGAVGAAQNMVGEAVHAVTLEENAPELEQTFKRMLPKESILVSKIDFQGARLVTGHEKL